MSGHPVPTEATADLEDIDGGALLAVLRHFGFDFDAFDASGSRRQYEFNERPDLESGELQRLIVDHSASHSIPKDQRPQPRVVSRNRGGTASGGGMFGWVKSLFGGR